MNEARELLSVIVPAYNAERWLCQCTDSILAQTYTNLELVLVDDGSTDKTSIICNHYTSRDSRVRVFHVPNGGPGVARSIGISKSHGTWLAFVDSDDWVDAHMYGTLIRAAHEHGTDIAGCAPCNEWPDGSHSSNFADISSGCVSGRQCNYDLLYQTSHAWGAMWGKVFRREVFDGIEFPRLSNLEDYMVMTKVYDKIEYVWFCEKQMYHHRLHEDSLSNGGFSEKKLLAINAAESIRDYFADGHAGKDLLDGADSLVFRMYAQQLWLLRKSGYPGRRQILEERRSGCRRALARFVRNSRRQKGDAKLLLQFLLAVS